MSAYNCENMELSPKRKHGKHTQNTKTPRGVSESLCHIPPEDPVLLLPSRGRDPSTHQGAPIDMLLSLYSMQNLMEDNVSQVSPSYTVSRYPNDMVTHSGSPQDSLTIAVSDPDVYPGEVSDGLGFSQESHHLGSQGIGL